MIIGLMLVLGLIASRGRFDFIQNPLDWLSPKAMLLPAIIIGITVHEFAHAFSAYKLGDMTPKKQKRVSLNPLRHIDIFGFIALLIVGFGWGKPVQINPYAFRHRRRDNLIVGAAGVVTNFVFAFIFAGLLKLLTLTPFMETLGLGSPSYYVLLFFQYVIQINLVLMVFNLLPVPPLDGFGIVTDIFGLRGTAFHSIVYRFGMPILLILLLTGFVSKVIAPPIDFLFTAIMNLFFPT